MMTGSISRAILVALLTLSVLGGGSPPAPPVTAQDPPWSWPIAAPHRIVRPWQPPPDVYSAGHRGIDIAADHGVSVYAPHDGVVHFSGRVVDRTVLTIAHPRGYLSSFEPLETDLRRGDAVARGQLIGTVAASGHCAESCLHFGVRYGGEYLSPLTMLRPRAPVILLPLERGHPVAALFVLRRAGAPADTSPSVFRL